MISPLILKMKRNIILIIFSYLEKKFHHGRSTSHHTTATLSIRVGGAAVQDGEEWDGGVIHCDLHRHQPGGHEDPRKQGLA
jgi:hypothetical protein